MFIKKIKGLAKEWAHNLLLVLNQATEGNKIIHACIVALSLFRLAHQSLKFIIESSFIDLGYHYFYSTMVRLGLDPFDPESIEKAKTLNPMRFAGGAAVYSPSYFVFFQPLTYIPFSLLSALWLLFSLSLVFMSVIALLRCSDWDGSWLLLTFISVVVATYQPLYEDLVLGQNNCLILILAVGAWYGFKNRLIWLSGLCIGVMAFIKIQFGFLIVFVLLLGQKSVFLISSVSWLGLFLAGLSQLGFTHYQKYFLALQQHTSVVAEDLNNISLNGLWHRLLGNDMYQATAVYLMTSLILFVSILRWFRQYKLQSSLEIPILTGLTMIPLVSPHTEEHHLVLILLPLIFVAFYIERMSLATKSCYLLSVVLIVSRYSWIRFASSSSIFLMPLLSLKIIGVFLLLIVLISLGSNHIKKLETGTHFS